MRVVLAQLNPTIGDFEGNASRLLGVYARAAAAGADLVVAPELYVTGYPPRDLLLDRAFLKANFDALNRLAAATGRTALLVGFVDESASRPGRGLANAAALLHLGRIVAVRHKTLLPSYDVFDEDRYFDPAGENLPIPFQRWKLGVTICEDIWNDEDFWRERRYRGNPPAALAAAGAEIIFNLSASPWWLGKTRTRHDMLQSLARKLRRPVIFCNQVGGNDELIFDGHSLVFDAEGRLIAEGRCFAEDELWVDLTQSRPRSFVEPPSEAMVWDALVLGTRDYFLKCGFKNAVLGLSGGIDSALTACIASAALGAEHVHGISLPSQYSSPGSLADARDLAERLGIRYDVLPIQPVFEICKQQLSLLFRGLPEDVTEENLQARIRGLLLMALSNKFGSLLLTTGNKSELAVGYCTLYGDMNGGLAVISDVPKTMVYRLARWANRDRPLIPEACFTKPPSAELRPNQTDQDTLPPYEILDAILEAAVVQGRTFEEMVRAGHEPNTVRRVLDMVRRSEFKRRQAPPGLKVTTRAFGIGRRVPIAQRFNPPRPESSGPNPLAPSSGAVPRAHVAPAESF
ncbi:MAG: NAD+ synthase [Verrucomicrobiota bacterium]|nr:NAD+ synthase [Limisphaera sp.]MDW8382019.1 NAD+ synthase [Verrucomicrobiota bacterium]